jgi:periplasmic copper chaperone A
MQSSADRLLRYVAVSGLALALLACTGAQAPSVRLEISDAWVRASMGTDATAAYMRIGNSGNVDDELIGVTVEGAQRVELHRSMPGASGMHAMEPVAGIHVPAGGTATLEPGGFHLMLFELDEPLEPGDEVLIVLTFAQAGSWPVLADVRAP